ncbi:hypothetical protein Tco_1117556 [Tanacetum coccineum]
MDFLIRSSIHYALTVSPIVSTSFVEQFWTTAKSRTINNISYIDATVAGKPVTISKASIRSDLLFDDADGIDSLNNQALFDTIQLMGNQLKDVFVPLDHFPVPTLTKKVLTFMVKKGKNFSGKVTPLFDFMLVQQIEDEGEASERPSDSQPIPSPPHPSEDQPQTQTDPSPRPSPSIAIPDSNPEGFGGNHEGQSFNDISLSGNEDGSSQEAKERSQTTSHTSQILDEECCIEYKIGKKDFSEEKGGTKGKRRKCADKEVSTEAPVSTVKRNEGTDKRNEGTDKQDKGTTDQNEWKNATQTAPTTTSTPTPTIFGESDTESDDITEAEKKFNMLAKDEEVARKVQEEWEAKEEKKRQDLAEELQKEEREKFTIEQRAKFLHDTIVAQRKFLAQQRNTGYYIKGLKRQDQNFVAIGSAKDERQIKELNKDPKKKRVIKETPRKEDTTKYLKRDTMALELIRFVKKLIAELEPENSDGDEEDL